MKYRVLKDFTDTQDKNRLYRAGEEYPRAGYDPTKERIDELTSNKNRRGEPMIAAAPAENPETASAPAEKVKVPKKE